MATQSLVCIWLVLLGTCHTTALKNLASNGRATQSSLLNEPLSGLGHAYNAVDGNKNSDFYDGSCSQTNREKNPWWRLDLQDNFVVTAVYITSQRGRTTDSLVEAEVRVGPSLLNNGLDNPLLTKKQWLETPPAAVTYTFSETGGIVGRYVVVVLPGIWRALRLCEVEVYGYLAPSDLSIAIRGKATQSTLYGSSFANNANDGNKDGVFGDGSCSCTNNNLTPWWRLDLLKIYKIFAIAVTNRKDCCPERLNGAEIRIGNLLTNEGNDNPRCAVITSIAAGATVTYQCNGMDGRYVNLVIPGRAEYLTLCEVEVFGSPL